VCDRHQGGPGRGTGSAGALPVHIDVGPGRARRGCYYLAPLAEALSLEPAVTLAALEAGTWMVSPV
jgi:hypothetical protein